MREGDNNHWVQVDPVTIDEGQENKPQEKTWPATVS
jgi:hypothetical protein